MNQIHHRQGREFVSLAGIVCAGMLLLPTAQASLLLQFEGGGSSASPVTSQVDAFTGVAGDGWASGWTLGEQTPASTDVSAAVINTTPFQTGSGNYLSVSYSNSTATAARAGVVRRFSTDTASGGVDVTKPLAVNFELRFDNLGGSAMNAASDQYYFSLGPNSVSSFSANSPVRIFYQGGVGWRVNNGDSYTLIPGLALGITEDVVYKFQILIDPAARTWGISVTHDGQVYSLTDLALWSDTDLSSATYMSWRGTRNQASMDWSLDNVQISAVPEPGTVAMLVVGGAALMFRAIRRRR